MKADTGGDDNVWQGVEALFQYLAACRLEEAIACFAPGADVALFGSEISEAFVGPEALRAFLTKILRRSAGPRIRLLDRRMTRHGDVAWFTADAEVTVGGVRISPYRLTGVLEKQDGRWLWRLFNGSEPLPDRV